MADTTDSREVSRILKADEVDTDRLLPLVYDKLRAIAKKRMAQERSGHTLQATALVNEAYLKLVAQDDLGWESKAHFYAAAAESMRRILIDHARARGAQKRGGSAIRLPLDVLDLAARDASEILALDEAIQRLSENDPRAGDVVRLRFFAGLSPTEAAEALGISLRSVHREWTYARARLASMLDGD